MEDSTIVLFQIQHSRLSANRRDSSALPLTMSNARRGFFCEAEGCTYTASFKTKAAFTNHQRKCKAFKEEGERHFQNWKKQKILEAEAEAREAERVREMENISAGGGSDLNSSVSSSR